MRFDALFAWRRQAVFGRVTPELLVDAMSCESLRDEDVPRAQRGAVRAFRRLRQDARLRTVRAWLLRARPASEEKTPIFVNALEFRMVRQALRRFVLDDRFKALPKASQKAAVDVILRLKKTPTPSP